MLSEREKNVVEKIFGGMDEREACKKHNVSHIRLRHLYEGDDIYNYMEVLHKKALTKSRYELSRFGLVAVQKLGGLLENDKDETIRKAAVDILNKCPDAWKNKPGKKTGSQQPGCELSDDEVREKLRKLAGVS